MSDFEHFHIIRDGKKYYLVTNFENYKLDSVKACIKVSGLQDTIFAEAYDILGELIPSCIGLYVPEEEWENDKRINMYYHSSMILREKIYDYYHSKGVEILPCNCRFLYLGISDKNLKTLCSKKGTHSH